MAKRVKAEDLDSIPRDITGVALVVPTPRITAQLWFNENKNTPYPAIVAMRRYYIGSHFICSGAVNKPGTDKRGDWLLYYEATPSGFKSEVEMHSFLIQELNRVPTNP